MSKFERKKADNLWAFKAGLSMWEIHLEPSRSSLISAACLQGGDAESQPHFTNNQQSETERLQISIYNTSKSKKWLELAKDVQNPHPEN